MWSVLRAILKHYLWDLCVESGDAEILQLGVRVGSKKDFGFGNT